MVIREATEADIPALIRLLHQVGDIHHQIRPDIFPAGTLKYNESELAELLEDRPVFVAMEGESCLGYCFCMLPTYRASRCSVARDELYIDDLCVDESARGQGVATALYRHVCGYAQEKGCAFVTLNVWQGNDNAQRFYEKMGMRPRSITMEHPLEDTKC